MLTIYRASAGSGKTHRLTGDYLLLLFSEAEDASRILAVTFTNKATEEMKGRILQELYLLSSNKKSDYLQELLNLEKKSEAAIRAKAKKILIRLIHNYSTFNISTIDRFFQQTMRAFIREIGLQGNYQIELDQELVLSESVDELLSKLDQTEEKSLLSWLLRFSEEKVEKGESWDLRKEIKTLGQELFKESYQSHSREVTDQIVNKQTLTKYKKSLLLLIREAEEEARSLGEHGMSLMSCHSLLPSDFKGAGKSPFFFIFHLSQGKINPLTSTFKQLADQPENWYTKTASTEQREKIETIYAEGLNDCVKQVILFFEQLAPYYSAIEITRYYYTLGILSDIASAINRWRKEKNTLLIADTTELLNKVINGSEVPFIYEKTGTYIAHYMIDEFQDTSRMQWHNFRPLIKESLAYHRANLIVGDVKQSIYRFRNSDWTLLDEHVKEEFVADDITEKTLDENWRSCRSIVEFNNTFFAIAPTLLQQQYNEGITTSTLTEVEREKYGTKIIQAYRGHEQRVAPPYQTKEGHVRVELLSGNEEQTWEEEAMKRLPLLIEQLQEAGYQLNEMALLVRTRKEGLLVAETLLAYKESYPESTYRYDIISEDALLLGGSVAVRFMISMIRFLNRPDDPSSIQLAQMMRVVMQNKRASGDTPRESLSDSLAPFLQEQLQELQQLAHRSFYEMVEGIYRHFITEFPENEQIYLQAFLDVTAEYAQKNSADMTHFLRWWKENGAKKRIVMPDSQNAIRILTIHKSKGLGFKAVIIPFGDWGVDQKSGSILWCQPTSHPFNQLPLVPIRYSKELIKTHFSKEYYHEKLHAYIDNLNALYVAFTRAKETLIIFTPDHETKRTKAISQLIRDTLQSADDTSSDKVNSKCSLAEGMKEKGALYEWGGWWSTIHKQQEELEEIPVSRITSILLDDRIHLRLQGKDAFFDDTQRRYGLLMHELLSRIHHRSDLDDAIKEKVTAGEINREESKALLKQIAPLLTLPQTTAWFDGSMQVLNEVEILFGNGESRRPDRIMINHGEAIVVDYKFGEEKEAHHQQQIKKYITLIRSMGYHAVEGFLWYVELNKIVRVDF